MAKAKRLLADQLSRVDVVVELCDARLPRASRNPDLIRLTENKKRVLILEKSDLADPKETEGWLRYFRVLNITCAAVDINRQTKTALALIENAARETVDRAALRGINKTVRAMVVGVPNVGKSTFINRLHGSPIAKAGDMPGVTRANQWVRITPYLEILDTPGLLWPRLDDQKAALRLSYIAAIRDEIQDTHALAVSLLNDLMETSAEAVMTRFKVKDGALRGEELLEAVCRGRGFLMRGGVADTERACAVVLDEFRVGKLGRVTLERAPGMNVQKEETKKADDGQETGKA
jgi:ribosome biogenesis GTPase A